ncbi:MAG: PD-(D/E)XK nuclease family protein [Aquificota bacterium]|nr:MAG: PD-(D/E)XK nuclease family protein [Aquificota bacterium]HAV39913.1 hypothetical protein [Aquificaceae bacterium]HCO39546.1 hypothetical protein [Aquificaceae bacterium]
MGGGVRISRSKIELFMECPRCFWLEVKHGIKRPERIFGGNIGQIYDNLLKAYFDKHRENSTVPDAVKEKGFNLYPRRDKLERWRKNGIEYYHEDHGIIYWGKIDDLLIDSEGRLVPLDFKTTLKWKNENKDEKDKDVLEKYREKYKRQLEIYGYLLYKNGERVANVGALYVVTVSFTENFEKQENPRLIPLEDLNYEQWDILLEHIKEVFYSDHEPKADDDCEFCNRDVKVLQLYNFQQYLR